MQFTVKQESLSRMLSVVNHAVARGTGVLPIATNIRLASDPDGRIRLDATNLSIGMTGWVEGTIVQKGNVAVPAKLFTDLITAMAPGKIEIKVDSTTYDVQVIGPRGTVHVRGVDPEEFPDMPGSEPGEKPTLLKAALLKEVIREVSIAEDDSRSEIFGNILLQIEQQQITFAAADGYGKLAFRTLPLPAESALIKDILVPARSLAELVSNLPNDGMVEIRLTPNASQIILSTQWMVLSSILSSGSFPNFRAAVPDERQTRATVKTADLSEIVRVTTLFAKSDSDAGHITIGAGRGLEPGTLTMVSEAVDIGGNNNTIPAVVEGEGQINLTFNVAYIAKVLSVTSAPELIFAIGVTKAPVCVMQSVGSYTCLHSFASMGGAH